VAHIAVNAKVAFSVMLNVAYRRSSAVQQTLPILRAHTDQHAPTAML
jgi:hypothetical protein